MNWFKKKKESVIEIPVVPKECSHIWCDFSPYMSSFWQVYYNDANRKRKKEEQLGVLKIKIFEPYVCVLCHKREDATLLTKEIKDITRDAALKIISDTQNRYDKFCAPHAEVEDKINDLIHNINREFLERIALYQPEKVGSIINPYEKVPTLSKFLKGE